jgi:hypothetical protein
MSGGSWDYITHKFDDVANQLKSEKDPLRRLMGQRVALLAKAMHDIEWVDSGDYSEGDDLEAINAFLWADSSQNIRDEIAAVVERTKGDIDKLQRLYDDHWSDIDD